MPIYCYSNTKGAVFEAYYPMGQAPEVMRRKGVLYRRDFQAEHANTRPPGNWPMESDALGVNPEQVAEANAHSIAIGVPTEHNPVTGCPILTSPEHRKRYARALGFHDRNGGYGDP